MDAEIAGMADQVFGDRALEKLPPARFLRPADDDMGEIVGSGISDDLARGGERRQGHGLGAELFGKAHMVGQPVLQPVGQHGRLRRFEMQHRPGGAQPVGLAAGITHQIGPARAVAEADQHPVSRRPRAGNRMRLHVVEQLLVDALGGAAQRQLAQRRQVAGRKIVLDCLTRRLRHIDLAVMQPLDQVGGGDVDDLDLVGPVDDRIRHRLAHAHPGDLGDDVVQALDMLDVQRRIDVDAARQQFLDIHGALGMAAARRIGVGEFVDQHQGRAAGEDGVEIHLLQRLATIGDGFARDDLETVEQRLGFAPPVGLDDADDHVDAIGMPGAAGHQHLIGLADAGGGAEEDLEPALRLALGALQKRVRRGSLQRVATVVGHGVSCVAGCGYRSLSI